MKFTCSLFFLLLVLSCASYAQSNTPKYYCPPCNCTNDAKIFDHPGVCPDPGCQMELLPVEGEFVESKLKFLSTFLRSGWITEFYNLLILPSIIQGLILSLILVFRGAANRLPSYFLAALLTALCLQNVKFYYILIVLANHLGSTGGNPEYDLQSLSLPLSGVLFIGPSLYFYVRSLAAPDFQFRPWHLWHFSPGFLFMLINSLVFFGVAIPDSPPAHSVYVSFFTIFTSLESLLAIGLAFWYIILSVKLMKHHELWVYQHFSTTTSKSLSWLRKLIVALSLVWVIWLFAVVINLFTGDYILTYLSSYPFQIATSVIIFWVGYMGFIQSEVFSAEVSLERKIDNMRSVSGRNTESNAEIKSALLKAMEADQLYLVPELSLSMLGNQLNISPKSISQTMNSDLNKNFHDFVNEYRVEEVKKRLVDPAYGHLTILAIGLDSGFNSKSSFNRIFMKATGVSPKEYKETGRNAHIRQLKVS